MLKSFNRSEIREAVILLVFSALLFETLTPATIGLVVIGAVMVWLRYRPSAFLRNVLSLGIFASYWITYGKVIDPEIGLNFLTSITTLKLLEKETERDSFMIFFGLILLISAGSLFQKSLAYVVFFALSFFLMIQDFYKTLRLPTKLRDLLGSLLWVLPFTAFLFFLAPRMMNPFQLEKGTPGEGEVGYTPEVNMSQIESLSSNDSPVFQAEVESAIQSQDLYWRGNTLSFTDGWNWPLMPQNRQQVDFDPLYRYSVKTGIKQRVRVFSQQDFYFGFDHPTYYITPQGTAILGPQRSLPQHRWKPSQRYEVISHSGGIEDEGSPHQSLLQLSLNREERDWIHSTFKSDNLPGLQAEIENFLETQQFSYSLSPGKIESFLHFMTVKKVGFCSHYASAIAQILRAKKIPTRLVSGFMGGRYNKFAGFYLVTQNDAHVWVEAMYLGRWRRLDPTGWIAPDRVRLGGEAYMQQLAPATFSPLKAFGSRFAFLRDLSQWIDQWDFKFYRWLEEMDYYGQAALLERLHFKREWIFSLFPILIAVFMGFYAWHLSRAKTQASELEKLWLSFQRKLKSRGLDLPLQSVREGSMILMDEDEAIKSLWDDLVKTSFGSAGTEDLSPLKKRINKL